MEDISLQFAVSELMSRFELSDDHISLDDLDRIGEKIFYIMRNERSGGHDSKMFISSLLLVLVSICSRENIDFSSDIIKNSEVMVAGASLISHLISDCEPN